MARILLLLLIAFLIYLVFRGFFRSQTRKPPDSVEPKSPEDMITCAQCGVHMPRSAARDDAGKLVCRDNPNCH